MLYRQIELSFFMCKIFFLIIFNLNIFYLKLLTLASDNIEVNNLILKMTLIKGLCM